MGVRLRTKRIVAIVVVVVALTSLAVAYLHIKNVNRAMFVAQARVDGLVAHAEGNYEMALGKLGFYVRREPTDLQALLAFADARSRVFALNNRHLPHAVHIYLSALERDPKSREALEGLMRVYDQLGWRMEWMNTAQRMLALDPDHINALRLMADGFYFDSDFDRCMPFIDRLIELAPDDLRWRIFKLHVMREQRVTVEEQLALCRTWRENFESDSRYHALKAIILAAAGNVNAAREVARDGVERGLGAATELSLSEMLRVLMALQMEVEAADLLEQTKLRHQGSLWPHEQSVRRLWQLGQIVEALDEVAAIAEERPLSSVLLRYKCMLLLAAGDIDRASAVLSAFEERVQVDNSDTRDGNRGWLIAMKARLELAEDDWPAAMRQFHRALGLSPADATIHYFLGEAHAHLGEHEQASHHFERATQLDPHWHSAQILYVHSQLAAGHPRAAWQRLLRIVEREPAHPYLYVLLAEAWLAAEEPNDELPLRGLGRGATQPVHLTDVLHRLHEHQPGPRVTDALVRLALRYNRKSLARSVIEHSLNTSSGTSAETDAGLLVNLARSSVIYGLGYEQDLIERAIERNGLTPELAAVTARWHHLQGRTDEGLQVIDDAFADRLGRDAKLARLRMRASYLAECFDNRATDDLAKLFDADPTASTASFVLAQPAVWSNVRLVERAIDVLASQVGEESPRVGIARAALVLHHHAEDHVRVAEALVRLHDVLRVSPDSLAALLLMVDLSLAGDRPEPRVAIRHLERAIEAHPYREDLHIRLIRLLQQQGDFAAAQYRLDRFSEIAASRGDLLETRLALLELQGRFDHVANLLAHTVDDSSTEADRVRLVQSLRLAGEHDRARRMLQDLLDSPEPGAVTIRLAADFHASAGEFDKGLELLESAVFGCEVEQEIAISDFLSDSGRTTEAVERMTATLHRHPGDIRAITRLSAFHAQQGNAQAAFDTAIAGMSMGADNAELRMIALTTATLLGKRERTRVRELLGDSDESGPFIVALRLLEQAADGGTSSREDLAAAASFPQRYPESLLAWRTAIGLHVQAGAMEEATRLARLAATALPRHSEPAQIAAELHAQAEQWPEALEMGRMWRQRSHHRPYLADIFVAHALLALNQPQQAAAVLNSHFARMIAERDSHPEPLQNWIRATLLAGDVEVAAQHIDMLLCEPGPLQAQWLETAQLLPQPAAEKALASLEPHLLEVPQGMLTLASAWGAHAHKFEDDRSYARSDNYAARAYAADETLAVPALLLLAQNAERQSRVDEAETFYREALSIDPMHVVALNNLAAVLQRNDRNCDEALALSEKAVRQASHIPELHHTRAYALICMQDYLGAEASARRALALRDSCEFHVTLGIALALQGRTNEAEQILDAIEKRVANEPLPTRDQQSRLERLRGLIATEPDQPGHHS